MGSPTQPLLVLSQARAQEELGRAATAAADALAYRRRWRRLALVCLNDFLIGLVIIGVSMQMTTGELAYVIFYLGLIRALCWPMWTVLLAVWLEENGWSRPAPAFFGRSLA